MSSKSDAKKQLILEKAAEVFAGRGYRNVTMKDIVEACGISRGGLYIYYDSVEEIFEDVLDNEDSADLSSIDLTSAGSVDLLLYFLKEEKKEILKKKNNLTMAYFEYAFACKCEGKADKAKKKMDQEVLILQKILDRGSESGEFVVDDAKAVATDMVYAINGMKVCAQTVGITEKKVDKELVYMMRRFMEVEE
ncbi:MAG: TetR/AcrR family transcriptional regulator [Lachnospiraceae bacterium]|nr:TetR/AcrR family transcriptional regulator [Lachnospiraceae bacterium]